MLSGITAIEEQSMFEAIKTISIFAISIGALVYVFKVFFKKVIDRYYEGIDKRAEDFKSFKESMQKFTVNIQEIVGKMESLTIALEHHKEYNEVLREAMLERYTSLELKLDNEVEAMKERFAEGGRIQEERYKELKGKIGNKSDILSDIKARLVAIESEHRVHHGKK